jgi:glutamine synthetase
MGALNVQNSNKSLEAIINELKDSDQQRVKVAITDIDGVLRGKYLYKDKFLSALNTGFGFCNVIFGWDSSDICYDNGSYTGWHTGYPDASVRIDPNTYRRVPWDSQVPFFLGEFRTEEDLPLPICPRQVLRRVIARAEKLGVRPMCGMEFEWFNFRETPQSLESKNFQSMEPLTPGMFGYSITRSSMNQPFFEALMNELRAFGIPLEGLHTETGPGVLEAAILFSDALECADRAVLFKTSVKEIAYRFGIVPTFMAKWNSSLPGSSGHIHQSLRSASDGRNLFYDENSPHHMSKVFRSYIAGQMKLLPELLPLFAPTVNSYKRLVDGYWAPTQVTWGIDNRTVSCRIIPGSSKSTRLETRVPGADVNPYLAIAASIASGIYGVEENLTLDSDPVVGSAYINSKAPRLPRTLQEATQKLSRSEIGRALLGNDFVDHFVKTREWEWRQYQNSVSDWELKRYFELV